MEAKTERVTILTSSKFKAFLHEEALKEGVSVSELVRERCAKSVSNHDDELLLAALVDEVNKSSKRARKSLNKGLRDAKKVLRDIKQKRSTL